MHAARDKQFRKQTSAETMGDSEAQPDLLNLENEPSRKNREVRLFPVRPLLSEIAAPLGSSTMPRIRKCFGQHTGQ